MDPDRWLRTVEDPTDLAAANSPDAGGVFSGRLGLYRYLAYSAAIGWGWTWIMKDDFLALGVFLGAFMEWWFVPQAGRTRLFGISAPVCTGYFMVLVETLLHHR